MPFVNEEIGSRGGLLVPVLGVYPVAVDRRRLEPAAAELGRDGRIRHAVGAARLLRERENADALEHARVRLRALRDLEARGVEAGVAALVEVERTSVLPERGDQVRRAEARPLMRHDLPGLGFRPLRRHHHAADARNEDLRAVRPRHGPLRKRQLLHVPVRLVPLVADVPFRSDGGLPARRRHRERVAQERMPAPDETVPFFAETFHLVGRNDLLRLVGGLRHLHREGDLPTRPSRPRKQRPRSYHKNK